MIAMCVIAGGANAQTVNSNTATVEFDKLVTPGSSITMAAMARGNSVGTVTITANDRNSNEIDFDLSSMGCTRAMMHLYNGERLVRSVPVSGGPAPDDIEIVTREKLVHAAEVRMDEDWWPIVVALALCCLQAEVGSLPNGGCCSWSVGFDCDCFGGRALPFDVNGTTYEATRIVIQPLDGDFDAMNECDRITVSSKGARITRVR